MDSFATGSIVLSFFSLFRNLRTNSTTAAVQNSLVGFRLQTCDQCRLSVSYLFLKA